MICKQVGHRPGLNCLRLFRRIIRRASLLVSALYEKCPYYWVLYMQSALIFECFIYKVPLLLSALYAKCPYYYLVLYIQSALTIECLYAKCPYYWVLYMQSVFNIHLQTRNQTHCPNVLCLVWLLQLSNYCRTDTRKFIISVKAHSDRVVVTRGRCFYV